MRNFFNLPHIKQVLLGAVIGTLIVGPFQPLIAQAQVQGPTLTGATLDTTAPLQGPTLTGATLDTVTPASTPAAASAPTAAAGSGITQPASANLCSGGTISGCLSDIIYVFTVGIGSAFAYVAAQFFNLAINLSLNGPIYALTFISTSWTTARDLANMAFLFILIYIAYTIILQAETSHTLSLLAGVIAIALLVNFSFFFTRLVIDAGNILSIQFYNSITAPTIGATASSGGTGSTVASAVSSLTGANTKDLTAGIMGMMNIQGLFNTSSFSNYSKDPSIITLVFLYIAMAIILWILSVTFVTAGVKFLVRIVMLWFLIIASPLAFVARAIPQFRKYFDQWMSALVAHAFYPAAFMFIFLILNQFCVQMSQGGQGNFITNLFSGSINNGNPGIANIGLSIVAAVISLSFIVIILYVGLKVSDKIGVAGAGFATKAGSSFGGVYSGIMKKGGRLTGLAAGGLTAGVAGGIGRNTLGLAGNAIDRSTVLRTREAKGGILGLGAKALRGAGAATAGASFDLRAAPGVSKGLTDVVGVPQKGGYAKAVEESVKAKEKKAKDLEPNAGDKSQARAKAEKEEPYKAQKTIHESAKKEFDNADKQIKELEATPGGGDSETAKSLKVTRKAQKAVMERAAERMKKREQEISGEGTIKKKYAETLVTRRLGNFGIITRAAREAADHIRHEKSKDAKLLDAVKEATKVESEHDETPAHAPVIHAPAPRPAATAPAPATPPAGGGHAGGEHH